MTALPSISERRSQAQVDWVPIDEAAAALGVSERRVRQLADQEWAPRGMATMRQRADGRGKCWHIAAGVDPRLVRRTIERAEDGRSWVAAALKAATAEQRDDATRRAEAVRAYRAWRSSPGVRVSDRDAQRQMLDRLARDTGVRVSLRTLQLWSERCPPSNDLSGCIAYLLDGRSSNAGPRRVDEAAWSMFRGLYLDHRQPSVRLCWEAVAARAATENWSWPSYGHVKRLVRERIPPGELVMAREGKDAWRAKHQAPIEQNPEAFAVNECWEGDTCVFDLEVRVRGARGEWERVRPQLTAWLDRRSRRLMGWVISRQGNSAAIRAALVAALATEGVYAPSAVWIDNGKDFASAAIGGQTKAQRRAKRLAAQSGAPQTEEDEAEQLCRGVLGMLGIEPHFARVYNHNGKARVERFFRIVHERFDKLIPSYKGNRPGMLDKREQAARTKNISSLPEISEFADRFIRWAEWYNDWSDRSIDELVCPETCTRLSAAAYYDRHLPVRRVVDQELLPLLGQEWSKPLKVHKTGISVRLEGKVQRFGAGMVELSDYVGTDRRVLISIDRNDVSRVQVWTTEGSFVCTARANDHYGGQTVPIEDFKAALKRQEAAKRAVKQSIDRTALAASVFDLAHEHKFRRDAAVEGDRQREINRDYPADAPPLRLVESPLDGREAQRARQAKAAGAEHQHDDYEPIDLSAIAGNRTDRARPGDDLPEAIDLAALYARRDCGPGSPDEHDTDDTDVVDLNDWATGGSVPTEADALAHEHGTDADDEHADGDVFAQISEVYRG